MNRCKLGITFISLKLIICMLLFSGCVSPEMIPQKDSISKFHTIEIVAIEPPELDFKQTGLFPKDYRIVWGYRKILSVDNVWIPTVILANKAEEILKSNNNADIKLIFGFVTIPGPSALSDVLHFILLPELPYNWSQHRWYNADVAILKNYAELKKDAILEIGITNYELMGDKLFLQVHVKLVEGKTGTVIGRSKNGDSINIGSEELAFSNNANLFKEKYSILGNILLEKTLRNLNMIP